MYNPFIYAFKVFVSNAFPTKVQGEEDLPGLPTVEAEDAAVTENYWNSI